MPEVVEVHMGEVQIACAPSVLRTNLGSCVGVAVYDSTKQWGGLAHIVSPESIQDLGKVSTSYADIAIPTLLDMLYEKGCFKQNFTCSIGGGGCMFGGVSDIMDIGKKNITAVKHILARENIPISRAEVGGPYSTIVLFDTATGSVAFDRKKSDLNIVIQKEKDYKKCWVDQNTNLLVQLETYLKVKQSEFVVSETGKADSQKLLDLIRTYSKQHNLSRLIGYVVYTKIVSGLDNQRD